MPTNFPNGVTSYGIPVVGSGTIPVTGGKYYFVSSTYGVDGNSGLSFDQSLKTIAAAVSHAVTNDVVLVFPGSYSEVVTLSVAGVHLIGVGDLHSIQWTSATDTTTLTISAANCEVAGFYFKPPTFTAGTPAAIVLSNAAYTNIHNNRFQGQTGSYDAIFSPVCNSDNVTIANNDFEYLNTASHGSAIRGLTTGGLSYSAWQILNNKFSSCVTAIQIDARVCLIKGNDIGIEGITAAGAVGAVCTLGIDLSGTSSGANLVHGNYLGGAYSATLYKVGATVDDWSNFVIAGITSANPA